MGLQGFHFDSQMTAKAMEIGGPDGWRWNPQSRK
jgi:hypothetical protein